MSFCPRTTITNNSQRDAPFPSASVFPAAVAITRNASNNLPNEGSLERVYNRLVEDGRLLSVEQYKASLQSQATGKRDTAQQQLAGRPAQDKATLDTLKAEFCYNYDRYRYSLNQLFNLLATTSTAGAADAARRQQIQAATQVAIRFNTKLNDLILLSNFISKKRATEAAIQTTDINALNSQISSTFSALQAQREVLGGTESEEELRRRMAEFSYEKNKSANNLLGLYGFLNLVAIGLLFYIYRK